MTEKRFGRREFLAFGAGTFTVLGLGRLLGSGKRISRRSIPVMGTIGEVLVAGPDTRRNQQAIELALDELRTVHSLMTRFDPQSDVGRVNRYAHRDGVIVSPQTLEVLQASLDWASATDGLFDPCLGVLSESWDHENVVPPDPSQWSRLAGARLFDALDLDPRSRRVRLTDARAKVDLGAIAKGYAVDRAIGAMRDFGVECALVNAGGDLRAIGRSPDGDRWRVGVRDPEAPERVLQELPMRDEAVATSGDYMRFFEHEGTRYHHLIDPRSAAPARGLRSVTVEASTCMTADALATARFNDWAVETAATKGRVLLEV